MQAASDIRLQSEPTARQRAVLSAVVQRYLRGGEAVSSKAISGPLDISPATARVELARLCEMGLLEQAHGSAGRTPTGLGIRYYVERLMRQRTPATADRHAVEAALRIDEGPEARLRAASRALAHRCTLTALGRRPSDDAALVERLELVWLGPHRVLAVALLDDGAVRHRTLRPGHPVTPALVAGAQALFAERFAGGPLEAVRARLRIELAAAREANRPAAPLLGLAASALPERATPTDMVIIEGRRHLLDGGLGGVTGLLDTAEETECLLRLLEAFDQDDGARVILGADTPLSALHGRALVVASFATRGAARGALAVIGPMRMPYSRVVPWVAFTAGALTRLAEHAA